MSIEQVRLVEKSGGKSGHWTRDDRSAAVAAGKE
jgi:hypothetical protein